MALTDTQVRQLKAKLEAKHVKTRKANGTDLHYVEGWHVIAEERIPEPYWLPQPPKLDRQAIFAELKRGIDIPGAQMSNPKPVLSVRTK